MIVDLRSDVLTKPSRAMLESMLSSTFDDDVFEEEQTVKKLEEKVASLTGKEAALFVVSGTMANQLAIAAETSPRDEVLVDLYSHIFQFEQGSPAIISAVQLRPIKFNNAAPDKTELESAIRLPDIHHPHSRLLCLEITRAQYSKTFVNL